MKCRLKFFITALVTIGFIITTPINSEANQPEDSYAAVDQSTDHSSGSFNNAGYGNKANVKSSLGLGLEKFGDTGRWLLLTSLSLLVVVLLAKFKMVTSLMEEEHQKQE